MADTIKFRPKAESYIEGSRLVHGHLAIRTIVWSGPYSNVEDAIDRLKEEGWRGLVAVTGKKSENYLN